MVGWFSIGAENEGRRTESRCSPAEVAGGISAEARTGIGRSGN